jgi:aryl-alcohol dehydrogenase-like predicted oxidoreductase
VIGGGALTGKYNTENDEAKRYGGAGPRSKAMAEVVMAIATEIGRTPAQVAINWVRQQQHKANMIPILGARTESQMRDNLAVLEFELSPEHVQRLDEASQFNPGFPQTFLKDDEVIQLVFGNTYPLLDNHRA